MQPLRRSRSETVFKKGFRWVLLISKKHKKRSGIY